MRTLTDTRWENLSEVTAHHATREVDWFAAGPFFRTRLESDLLNGRYFVTSEQFDDGYPRLYTVREVADNGDVNSASDFQAFETADEALTFIEGKLR